MIHFKDTKNKSALSTRWLQMTKQEQIIEKKKMEIQAKLEAQKQAAALAAQAKLTKDRHRRWNDRGRHRQHSPTTPIVEDRKKNLDTLNIPPLMQLSVRPPDDHSPPSSHTKRWESHDGPMNDDYDHDDYDPDDQDDNSQDNPNSDSSMGQSSMNFGPMGCGPGLMGPGFMGPGPMGAGPMGPGPMGPMGPGPNMPPGASLAKIDKEGLKLTNVNRNNHALMQYAMTNYGTTNLSVEDWKKCENNFKLNLLYQDMLKKRQEVERLAAAGKHKYEYDSDEDTSDGTWEHRLRAKEMNATERWATELTKQAEGKHHIGDFLPPEELKKFMEKYSAVKSGKEPDLSDYKEYKLKEDNVGFKMLQKLGWSEGEGLGAEGTGIVEPINKAKQPVANLGLGAASADGVCPDDDEFDAYRKRMMLAYRFRPNPLNNPRRPYY